MNSPEFTTMSNAITGLLVNYETLLSILIRDGYIKKDEMDTFLDVSISTQNEMKAHPALTATFAHIIESLNRPYPDPEATPSTSNKKRPKTPRPDWLLGVIDGGKKEKP